MSKWALGQQGLYMVRTYGQRITEIIWYLENLDAFTYILLNVPFYFYKFLGSKGGLNIGTAIDARYINKISNR